MTNPLNDPDVQHLLNLLDMTPQFRFLGLGKTDEIWFKFCAAHPAVLDVAYVTGHLGDWTRDLRNKDDWNDALRLAGYCLGFFDVAGHQPACEVLDMIGRPSVPPNLPGSIGRLWLTSVVEVSWRLFVKARAVEASRG